MLEDSSGRVQAVISPELWEAHRVLLRVMRLSELPVADWASAAD